MERCSHALQVGLHTVIREARAEIGAPHGVVGLGRARLLEVLMPGHQSGAQGRAGVAGGGLDPDPLEDPFPQQLAVGHAVEGHAAGEAEVGGTGVLVQAAGQLEHDLLGDHLDRGGQIHMELTELRFPLPWRPAEQLVELAAGHPEAAVKLEVAQIQPEGAIGLDVDQVATDRVGVDGLAIGREPHQLVFARIHLEAAVIGEGGIKQPQRMREADLPQRCEPAPLPQPGRSGGPFPHPIHAEHGRFLKGAGVEGGAGVGKVVLREEQLRQAAAVGLGAAFRRRHRGGELLEFLADLGLEEELFLQPHLHRSHEGASPPGRGPQIGFQQPLKGEQRFFVIDNRIQITQTEVLAVQAETHGLGGKGGIVFAAAEALFLGRGQHPIAVNQGGGTVVVIGRDTKDSQVSAVSGFKASLTLGVAWWD